MELVKVDSPKISNNIIEYLYVLMPGRIAKEASILYRFLKRTKAACEKLEYKIRLLKQKSPLLMMRAPAGTKPIMVVLCKK